MNYNTENGDYIVVGNDVWQWDGLTFDAYGLAVQYYEFNVLARFHDLTLDQIKTLACMCYKPVGSSEKLTLETLGSIKGKETYKIVKKKLLENLPMQELHKELTESSARFESGMTENTKQKESTS